MGRLAADGQTDGYQLHRNPLLECNVSRVPGPATVLRTARALELHQHHCYPLDTPERMAIPYERWYGVLAKTNVELTLTQRRMVGGGGLYSTVGDPSNFLLAHMNQGAFKGYQLLQPETVTLMQSLISQTGGDFM
jgi:CubicO group peptidase (beta-lactamase class C family)